MITTRLSPTQWLVESSRSLQCNRPGCSYMVAIGKNKAGNACPECAKKNLTGILEIATYQVDIEEYTQNGCCSCPRFRCHLEPIVKRMTPAERRLERGRCHHIELCRKLAKEDDNFDEILALLPKQNQEDQK